MTHVTCRLTAKDRDQLRNPTLGNRVWGRPNISARVPSGGVPGDCRRDGTSYGYRLHWLAHVLQSWDPTGRRSTRDDELSMGVWGNIDAGELMCWLRQHMTEALSSNVAHFCLPPSTVANWSDFRWPISVNISPVLVTVQPRPVSVCLHVCQKVGVLTKRMNRLS